MRVSRAAVILCFLSSYASAQPADGPASTPAASPLRRSSQIPRTERKGRYVADLSQIKNATLESEAVFFDRLEKQKKIEDVRLETTFAAQRLNTLRVNLSPEEVEWLDHAEQAMSRAAEPLDSAEQFINAAALELRQFHEGSTSEAVAVASGRSDAAPLLSRSRRMLKGAERAMRIALSHLADAQKGIEQAGRAVTKALEPINQDESRRAKLRDCANAIEAATAALSDATELATALLNHLESTRREHLPECLPQQEPALTPAPANSNGVKASESAAACHGASLSILKKSFPALDALEMASAQQKNILIILDLFREQRDLALRNSEEADAIVHPNFQKVRRLQSQAAELLDQIDSELSETRRLLTQDAVSATKKCSHCGKEFVRTRKVLDPACVCANANEAMANAAAHIAEVRTLAQQMYETLDGRKADEQLDRTSPAAQGRSILGDPKGVLDQLTLALERTEEFRNQQFDVYAGEVSPPITTEAPVRSFPPMVATYAARTTWHYPTYFEDISLERYGLHHGCFQPFVSYGKFLANLALIPYNVCLDPPHTIQYDLGMYRPGDDAPHLIYLPRWDCKAALFEAAVWTGLFFTP